MPNANEKYNFRFRNLKKNSVKPNWKLANQKIIGGGYYYAKWNVFLCTIVEKVQILGKPHYRPQILKHL